MTWTAAQMPRLGGRVAVVTGGNSGIGRATATELARHGARVMLACRDIERGKQAADDIRNRVPDADIEVRHIDLADMTSVREFGEGYDGPLHLLVNNAGVMGPPRRAVTAHDFELQFGTNHLGHFVLTGLLLPALLVADDPRVVTVSSSRASRWHGGRSRRQCRWPLPAAAGLCELKARKFAVRVRTAATSLSPLLTAHLDRRASRLLRDRTGCRPGRCRREPPGTGRPAASGDGVYPVRGDRRSSDLVRGIRGGTRQLHRTAATARDSRADRRRRGVRTGPGRDAGSAAVAGERGADWIPLPVVRPPSVALRRLAR